MWESDSAPLQGDRPQSISNNLMVKNCDIIISVFWSRLGTDTGVEQSGTIEEIKYFIKEKNLRLFIFQKNLSLKIMTQSSGESFVPLKKR